MRRLRTVIIAVLLLAGAALPGVGQDYSMPAPVQLLGAGSVGGAYGAERAPEVRVFGWSADGKLAYVTVAVAEFKGSMIFRYIVFDAVTDTVVWELEDDSEEWRGADAGSGGGPDPGGAEDGREPTEISWARNEETVTRKLAEFGIVQQPVREVRRFPSTLDGERYAAVVRTVSEPDPYNGTPYGETPYPDTLASYTLTLRSDRRGDKGVTHQEEVYGVSVWVEGYLLSPFEPRMAILVGRRSMQFEMTPEVRYRFFGSNLEVGFPEE